MTGLQTIAVDAKPTLALTTAQVLSAFHSVFDRIPELETLRWLPTDNLPSDAKEDDWREPVLTGDNLACLTYTSGSTGEPKGVMMGHGNLLINAAMNAERLKPPESGTVVSWAPLFHTAGMLSAVIFPLYAGIPLVLMPSSSFVERPARWLQAITRYKGV